LPDRSRWLLPGHRVTPEQVDSDQAHSENQDYDGHSNEYEPIKDTFVGIAWLVNMERRWIIGGKRFATLGATRLGQAIETIAAVGTLRSGHGTDCNRTILIANATIEL